MLKVKIIIILLLVMTATLTAQYAGNVYLVPNAYSRSFGNIHNPSLIWDQNPNSLRANPALLGFSNYDFSIGFMQDMWLEKISDNYDFYESTISYYKNGIGFSLPFINTDADFGYVFSVDGSDYQSSSNSEKNYTFSVAFNPFDYFDYRPYGNKWEAAIGLSNTFSIFENSYGDADGFFTNIGIVNTIRPFTFEDDKYMNIELVQAVTHTNLFDTEMKYKNDSDTFIRGLLWGFSGKASIYSTEGTFLSPFIDNYFSVMYAHAIEHLFDHGSIDVQDFHTNGLELGFLDTVFLRYGFYDDKEWSFIQRKKDDLFNAQSVGMGFKIGLKDYFSFTYDYSCTGHNDELSSMYLNCNILKIYSNFSGR